MPALSLSVVIRAALVLFTLLVCTPSVSAQTAGTRPFEIAAIGGIGRLWQTASESFDAALGTTSGNVPAGGIEVAWRRGPFVRAEVGWFSADGERVDIVDGEVIPLGIPMTVTMLPIEVSAGYRFAGRRLSPRYTTRIIPYVGAGAGVLGYKETSEDAEPGEDVDERFTSYHLLAGIDVAFNARVAVGAEFRQRWVPGALGEGGVSAAFEETDLGGRTLGLHMRVSF